MEHVREAKHLRVETLSEASQLLEAALLEAFEGSQRRDAYTLGDLIGIYARVDLKLT